jgi:hypothetical protein
MNTQRQIKDWRLYYTSQAERALEAGLSSLARRNLRLVDACDAVAKGMPGGQNQWVDDTVIRLAVKN